MKKLFPFALVVASTLFTACSQEEAINPSTTSTINIPQAVVNTVNQTYPLAKVAYAVLQPNTFYAADITTSSTTMQAVLDRSGKIKEVHTQILQADLPAAIKSYLETNYKGYVFNNAFKKTTGDLGYRVEIESAGIRYSLFFDATGAFMSQATGKAGGKGHGPAITQLALADLPAPVQTSLNGYTFKRAMALKDAAGVLIYHIHAEKSGITYDLEIDASGKVLSVKEMPVKANVTKTDISTLTDAMKTYLNANYAGWVLTKAQAVMSGTTIIEYEVYISVGDKKYNVEFKADGTFEGAKLL